MRLSSPIEPCAAEDFPQEAGTERITNPRAADVAETPGDPTCARDEELLESSSDEHGSRVRTETTDAFEFFGSGEIRESSC